MAENEVSLDAFITEPTVDPQQNNVMETVNLEDEFAKLLNDFIGQDIKSQETTNSQSSIIAAAASTGLDSFVTQDNAEKSQSSANIGLDSFVTAPETIKTSTNNNGLDGIITPSAVATETQAETEVETESG